MQKYDTLTKWKNILALTKWPKKQNPVPVSFLMYNWVFRLGTSESFEMPALCHFNFSNTRGWVFSS